MIQYFKHLLFGIGQIRTKHEPDRIHDRCNDIHAAAVIVNPFDFDFAGFRISHFIIMIIRAVLHIDLIMTVLAAQIK